MTNPDITYTATFTLTQKGEEPIKSYLTFDPALVSDEIVAGQQPQVYEVMSWLASNYLYAGGIIDENNNVIDQETFDKHTSFSIRH